jgi:hypothetical protein
MAEVPSPPSPKGNSFASTGMPDRRTPLAIALHTSSAPKAPLNESAAIKTFFIAANFYKFTTIIKLYQYHG